MSHVSEEALRQRFEFAVGIRFEIVYSLETLLRAAPRSRSDWREQARARMPAALAADLAWFGNSSFFWILVGDALGDVWPGDDADAFLGGLRDLPADELHSTLLEGAMHDAATVADVMSGKLDLATALKSLPEKKREWLEHIELYPPTPESPTFQALSRCVDEPEEAKIRILRTLRSYHEEVFEPTWRELRPGLERSLDEKRRLFEATSLEEFFHRALIRVESDAEAGALRALRGGYTLPFSQIRKVYVVPSAFNHNRYWTAFESDDGAVVFLPYFDYEIPSLSAHAPSREAGTEIDLPLVFKALGDPTRFAMASLIANVPMSSAQLADSLGISRPTVSHHVLILREAGLLDEDSRGGSTYLSLRRDTLAQLTPASLRRFFGAS